MGKRRQPETGKFLGRPVVSTEEEHDSAGPVTDDIYSQCEALETALRYETDENQKNVIRAEIQALQTALKYAA